MQNIKPSDSKSSVRMRLSLDEAQTIKTMRETPEHSQSSELLLRRKLAQAQQDIASISAHGADMEELSRIFKSAVEQADKSSPPPKWLNSGDTKGMFSGIPSLLLSDLHFGEVIRSAEVNGVNEYNTEIAKARLKRVITKTIHILDQFKDAEYNGFCLVLAGDTMSGCLHDLPEFNDESPTQSIVTVTDALISAIDMLKERFGRIYIPCVVGNHDRVSYKRTKTKGAVFDSFAWVIYKLLERHYADDSNISFDIADGHAMVYKINGRTYLLSHGDDIKGGNSAISGVLTAFTLATMRKVKQWAGHGIKVDTCLWGHFHTLSWGHRYSYISNGSLCGVGEYSLKSNFGYEPPQQALWVTSPNRDIVASFNVLGDDPIDPEQDVSWVSLPKNRHAK